MKTTTTHTFLITEDHVDTTGSQRLDVMLAHLYPEISRTSAASHIKAGDVTVNGIEAKKPRHEVSPGDEVVISFGPPPVLDVQPQAVEFEVLAEEDDFLVVNKPAGLTVHHSSTRPEEITLVHGLLHRYPEFHSFESWVRPGIVHRIDKMTTGLLIVARNAKAQMDISNLFRDRAVDKTYLAIVVGHPPQEGEITLPVGRDPRFRSRMTAREGAIAPREARTTYKVKEYFEDHALVEVKIYTGRTHQIRVHFAALGHPLYGDIVYGRKARMLNRQALHAAEIGFTYNGKRYDYTSDLPGDLEHIVSFLRKHTT